MFWNFKTWWMTLFFWAPYKPAWLWKEIKLFWFSNRPSGQWRFIHSCSSIWCKLVGVKPYPSLSWAWPSSAQACSHYFSSNLPYRSCRENINKYNLLVSINVSTVPQNSLEHRIPIFHQWDSLEATILFYNLKKDYQQC